MPALFNHTIIASLDREISATFYRSILEADEAPGWGPFSNLTLAGGVMLQFAEPPGGLLQRPFGPRARTHHAAVLVKTGFTYGPAWPHRGP